MTTKERATEIISKMPDDVTVAEIISQLYAQLKIEKGIRQLDAGEGIEHSRARERLKRWLD